MGVDISQLPEKMQKQALKKIEKQSQGSAGSRSKYSKGKVTGEKKDAYKASKYANERVEILGEFFDSKKEARRWVMLKDMEERGEIRDLRRQVKYELIPAQKEDGKLVERATNYVADFVYKKHGKTVVEDVKGYKGGGAYSVFTIKRKLMLWLNGIRVTEV